jgi:hypothetical protein
VLVGLTSGNSDGRVGIGVVIGWFRVGVAVGAGGDVAVIVASITMGVGVSVKTTVGTFSEIAESLSEFSSIMALPSCSV